MAKRTEGPIAPRACTPDLPDEFDAVDTLRPHDDVYAAQVEGLGGDVDAAYARLAESVVDGASVQQFELAGATLTDVRVTDLRTTSLSSREGRWRTVLVSGGRIGTLDLARAELDLVELRGLRIDYLSLAAAQLRDVLFVDCVLGAVDLPQARLERVAFEGCRGDEVDTRDLRATDLDLRGLEALSFTDPAGLRGATLSHRQAEQHAAAFAASLGIQVRER